MKFFRMLIPVVFFMAGLLFITLQRPSRNEKPEPGEAAEAFQWWYAQRALPYDAIPQDAFSRAVAQSKAILRDQSFKKSSASIAPWHSLGPNNIGGRVLSLGIDPVNSNVIWAGSASGGLWKSTTGGAGANAWTYVNTGFPTLSISAIAIDTTDHNYMYIGTGEISYYKRALIGIRGARSSYGMGILKSTDGGVTWDTTSIVWTFPQITAVEKIIINPKNHNTLYAATTEGTYKSIDRGSTWTQILSEIVAMDIVINPVDTTVLYLSCGTYNSSPNPGLYKSTNAGGTWTKLTNGLPSSDFGRTALAISPTNPSLVYAGVVDGYSGGMWGLYRSTNAGATWLLGSTTDYVGAYAQDQGWYNNAIAVHPTNPAIVYCTGIDIYQSNDSGKTLGRKSVWTAGYTSYPPGGPEGASNYTHADHHAIVFDPKNFSNMYFGNDGGVFQSTDGGNTFAGRNGGFITTQFYPGFATSSTDSTIAIGGLQDNGVLRYNGNTQWDKIDGGDGGWSAIDPTNNNVMYDEYVYLQISKSSTGGSYFFPAVNGLQYGSGFANFIAPFVISESNPNILYAGANNVYKTTTGGNNWFAANGTSTINGTNISAIGVSWSSPDTLMAATGSGAPGDTPLFQIFSSTNGGATWTNVTGSLPNRYPTDIKFDRRNSFWAYASFSGYNTSHVFKTRDLGQTWSDISSNLPNLPAQTVLPDPIDTSIIYAGTDLGVYRTTDAGASWQDFNDGMPTAMIHDLKICDVNYALRAATQGNGVYERNLPKTPSLNLVSPAGGEVWTNGDIDTIRWNQKFIANITIELSLDSGATWNTIANSITAAPGYYRWIVSAAPTTKAMIRIHDSGNDSLRSLTASVFTIQRAYDLAKGWNLISLQINPAQPLVTNLFPAASSNAFSYDSGYVQRDTLRMKRGYWLKFPARQNFNFTGDTVLTDTIPLVQGWNMIGSITNQVPIGAIIQQPSGIIATGYFGYSNGYLTTDTLYPKKGYWVKAKFSGSIILSSTAIQNQQSMVAAIDYSNYNSITITDNLGKNQTIYFTDQLIGMDKSRFELPPVPPEACFDVRFASQRNVEFIDLNHSNYPIEIHGVTMPVTLTWQMRQTDRNYSLLNDGINFSTLNGSGSATLSGTKVLNLALHNDRIATATTPTSFVLYQNYPNPFNPSTRIAFDVKEENHIRIAIYNIAGQKVSTLIDETKRAGSYTVGFDATNLPSGIYFCKLEGANFSLMKKMLLIR
ncbi:MAG: T9SS type A sorting domain-containing protein [Bacteroidota bacterium]